MLRNFIIKIKCGSCPYRKQCHEQLNETSRLTDIIQTLTREVDMYEVELQRVQQERDKLKDQLYNLGVQELQPKDRNKIVDSYYTWVDEKGVTDSAENMITFLALQKYLDL